MPPLVAMNIHRDVEGKSYEEDKGVSKKEQVDIADPFSHDEILRPPTDQDCETNPQPPGNECEK